MRHLFTRNPEGLTHADNLVRRQGAGTQTALMTTTMHLCFQAHPRFAAHVPRADALGTIYLVRGERHQVDLELFGINLDLAGTLCRIDMKHNLAVTADFANCSNILDDANFVVYMHNGYHGGVITNRGCKFFQVKQAIRFRIQVGDFITLALQLTAGIQYRLVLRLERNNVFALLVIEVGGALDSEVIRLGCARCPDNFFRISVNQRCHIDARQLHRCLGLPAKLV